MSLDVSEKPIRSFSAQPGNTMMEYGVVAALIVLIALPGLYLAGGQLRQWTDGLKSNLNHHRDRATSVSQQALANSRAIPRQVGYAYTLSSGAASNDNAARTPNNNAGNANLSRPKIGGNNESYGDTINNPNPELIGLTGTGTDLQNPEITGTSTNRKQSQNQRASKNQKSATKKTVSNTLDSNKTGKGGTNVAFVPSKELPTVAGTMGRPVGRNEDNTFSGPKEPPQTAGAAGHPKIEEAVKKFIEPISEFVTTLTGGKPKQDKKKTDKKTSNPNSSNKTKTFSQPQGITTVVGTMGVKQGPPPSETTKSKTKTQTNKKTSNNGKTTGSSKFTRTVAPTQVAGSQARMASPAASAKASSQSAGNKKKTNAKSGK